MSTLSDKNIGGFDIAMNDSLAMRGVECIGNFDGQPEQYLVLDRLSADGVFERHAIQKLHRDKSAAVCLAYVVNRANVGMVESGGRLRFPLKARQRLGIAGYFLRQELERHKAMQPGVFGLVDNAHPAAAKLFHDAVVGNSFADHRAEFYVGKTGKSMRVRQLASILQTELHPFQE